MKSKEQVVILIDMDDTITNSTKHNVKKGDPLPENFFIPGALEFIRDMKQAGALVGVVSHAYVGYQPHVESALEKMDIKLDSFVTVKDVALLKMKDRRCILEVDEENRRKESVYVAEAQMFIAQKYVTFETKRDMLLDRFGKDNSEFMAKLSFKNMGILKENRSDLHVVTIGDSAGDLKFAQNILEELEVKTAKAVHLNAVGLEGSFLGCAKNMISELRGEEMHICEASSFAEIHKFMDEHMGVQQKVENKVENKLEPKGKFSAKVLQDKNEIHTNVAKSSGPGF